MNKRTSLAVILGCCATTIFGSAALAQADLSVSPSSTAVSAGSVFTVDVNVSNVSDLYAYQFDLSFNPGVLSVVSSSEGSFLSQGGSTYFIPGTSDNVHGLVAATADTLVSPVPGVTGSGVLAAFTFDAAKSGSSNITISGVTLLNSNLSTIGLSGNTGGIVKVGSLKAPEIDAGSTAVAVTILLGALAVMRGRIHRRPACR